MSTIRIKCENCGESLATADTDTLRRPMRGHMFASPDPFHDFPAPFGPHTEWVDMRCRYGNHRPFLAEDAVMLESGEMFQVEYPEPPKPVTAIKDENGFIHLQGELTEDGGVIPVGYLREDDRWEPKPCEVCGRVIKGAGPMASHQRTHQ